MRTGSNKIQVSKQLIMMYVYSHRSTSLPLNVRMVRFWEPQQLVGTELYHSIHGNASGNMELETVRNLMLYMWTNIFGEIELCIIDVKLQ